MASHWSQFWQTTKTLNSFSASENALGYRGELLAFWQQQFVNIKADTTVVDLGTGNGALALAAQRYINQQQLNASVIGIDAAAIDPCTVFANDAGIFNELRQIQFYAECSIEALPFNVGTVHLMLSQFALEYADREPAVLACSRTLAPKGVLVAVMHHDASDIAVDCRAGLKVISAFLFGSDFQQDARRLLTLATTSAPTVALHAANQQLLQSVNAIKQQFKVAAEQEWFTFVMQSFAPLFMDINPANLTRFNALLAQLTATYQRLTDQHQAALNEEGIALWAEAFQRQQLNANYAEHYIDGELLGWMLKVGH